MEAWEVLDRAADKIERDGWTKGAIIANVPWPLLGGVPTCALGGICHAAQIDGGYGYGAEGVALLAMQALRTAIGADFRNDDGPFSSVWRWNDAPGRTKEEVCAMLRAVAASLRAARAPE